MNISTHLIDLGPFPWTLRHVHPQHEIEALAQQIQDAGGVATTVLVRRCRDRYQLIHGSMRVLAARLLGYASIPARIVDVDEATAIRLAVEDHHRGHHVGLTPLETGWAVLRYIAEQPGSSLRQTAPVFGRSASTLSPYASAAKWITRNELDRIADHCTRRGFDVTLGTALGVDARTLNVIAKAGTERNGKALFRRAVLALALGRAPATEITRKLTARTPQRPSASTAKRVRPSNTWRGLWARIKAGFRILVGRFSIGGAQA